MKEDQDLEPEAGSQCRIIDGNLLYFLNVCYTYSDTTYQNYYLEYYPRNYYFSSYGKRNNSDSSLFTLGFFRMGDSDPEDVVDEDSGYYLPLFQTSDTHGHLADLSGNSCQYRLAYISDKVKDIRGSRKDLALLLDGGDIFQGYTMSNLLDGKPLSEAYQIKGYDAVTIGNHEFDWQIDHTIDPDRTLMDYDQVNSVPVVISNLYKDGQPVNFAEEYIILEKTAVDQSGNELPVKGACYVYAFAQNGVYVKCKVTVV